MLGFLIYPSRLMPAAVLLMAPPLAAAIVIVAQQRAARALNTLLAISALAVHIGLYQLAEPMATSNDYRALRCLSQLTAADSVIDGAYGDATQWIPALTGRAITHPHEHCSLFDEVDAQLAAQHPTLRFVGERISFGEPLQTPLPSGPALCETGKARVYLVP